MHTMDKTPKIVTIIGLVFEGFGAFGTLIASLFLLNIGNTPLYDMLAADTTDAELEEIITMLNWFGGIALGVAIITGVFFVVNMYLFLKLMRGGFDEKTAKTIYLYQAIWGGINLLFNTLTGILYLVSGVTGYGGHKEEKDIRDGI